ncbi:MAG TPA: phosphotransferase, partial [Pirellulales bacterium]
AERSVSYFESFRRAAASVIAAVREASKFETPIFPCIRDIHREHVLFQGNQVSGLIDFGALELDSPAADLARLLASMAIDQPALWNLGLATYGRRRQLSETEIRLVSAYDATAMLLSGINWLSWVFADLRRFENRSAVLARLDANAARLMRLANSRGTIAV